MQYRTSKKWAVGSKPQIVDDIGNNHNSKWMCEQPYLSQICEEWSGR
ncbi:hypothetical protein GPLA_3617 [Paraglaciecola polaris LMG 21857]|uniref:Uncharacterized protein n=1 Tax=Paraglaciecola polaris LMG 21857 TaxID=1129793 RepID=K7AGU1_9ALTE|nr:hypothetical protein GPLA_3617 [Paraglaciecola polaris LMG 21857]